MVTPEQLRLTARYSPQNHRLLRDAADRIEKLEKQLAVYNDSKLSAAYRILGESLPADRVSDRCGGFYYVSRLGYLCHKRGHPRSIGLAICTAEEYRNYCAYRRGAGASHDV